MIRAVVSVLTPVGPGPQPFLGAASESVRRLTDAAKTRGLGVEWVVALDGPGALIPPGECRVIKWSGPSGIAATRNAALSAVRGDWVVPLDSDDEIDADAVIEAIQVAKDRDWAWVGANRVLTDGGRTPHWFDEMREFDAGRLAEEWTSPFVFHPNSVLVRTDLILRIGGWPAIRVNEDLGMVLLASETGKGGRAPFILTKYRVWEGQQVSDPSYAADKEVAFTLIEQVVNARRAILGRPPISRPRTPGGAFGVQRRDPL